MICISNVTRRALRLLRCQWHVFVKASMRKTVRLYASPQRKDLSFQKVVIIFVGLKNLQMCCTVTDDGVMTSWSSNMTYERHIVPAWKHNAQRAFEIPVECQKEEHFSLQSSRKMCNNSQDCPLFRNDRSCPFLSLQFGWELVLLWQWKSKPFYILRVRGEARIHVICYSPLQLSSVWSRYNLGWLDSSFPLWIPCQEIAARPESPFLRIRKYRPAFGYLYSLRFFFLARIEVVTRCTSRVVTERDSSDGGLSPLASFVLARLEVVTRCSSRVITESDPSDSESVRWIDSQNCTRYNVSAWIIPSKSQNLPCLLQEYFTRWLKWVSKAGEAKNVEEEGKEDKKCSPCGTSLW